MKKLFLALVLALGLTACTTVSYEHSLPSGEHYHINYAYLLQDKDLKVSKDATSVTLQVVSKSDPAVQVMEKAFELGKAAAAASGAGVP